MLGAIYSRIRPQTAPQKAPRSASLPVSSLPKHPVEPQDSLVSGEPQLALIEPKLGSQPTANQALLARMSPYIKGVHVVAPAAHGGPPILGGIGDENGVQIPRDLKGLPSQRWTVTPALEASHRSRLEGKPNEALRGDRRELSQFVAPILSARYGHRENQVAVELGPADSTELADSLQQSGKNLYFGMDLSQALLEKGRELMNEPGYQIADAYQVQGNTYSMPFEDGVADVVCVSCHNPFFSASPSDKVQALAEVKRVLKPGGEFALYPWNEQKKHPAVQEFLEEQFDLLERHSRSRGGRDLLILKAKP